MKYISVLAASLALAGCQTAPMLTALPDGKQGYSVRCDGVADDFANCKMAAAETCSGNYQTLQTEEPIPGRPATGAMIAGTFPHIPHRAMTFSCN